MFVFQFKWKGLMLFELHTALYWKANKKYAASQGIKPQFEVENKTESTTAVSNMIDKFLWITYLIDSS